MALDVIFQPSDFDFDPEMWLEARLPMAEGRMVVSVVAEVAPSSEATAEIRM